MSGILALLGSINIGGNRVKMAALKEAFEEEGLDVIATVAASGNVILNDARDPAFIEAQLERILADRFGFKSCVMVRTRDEVEAAITDNHFHGEEPSHGSDKMVHSIFLSQPAPPEKFAALLEEHKTKGSERLALGPRVLYLDYVHGVGVSDLSSKFLERRLGVKGTARNMNSLKNILAKMG